MAPRIFKDQDCRFEADLMFPVIRQVLLLVPLEAHRRTYLLVRILSYVRPKWKMCSTMFRPHAPTHLLIGERQPNPSSSTSRAKLTCMEVTLRIPDDVAKQLSASSEDVPRRVLEALALEGYREQTLTLCQVSEMLGLSRVETEDFLGQHHVPLAIIDQADLDREAALFEAASRRTPR